MKAIILVGGEGTRLRPLTWRTPKCMVPVLNTPFLEYVIKRLRDQGVTTVVLGLGHLARPVQEHLGDGGRLGVKVVYSIEEMPLGTAGPVKLAEKHLDTTFFVLNGDVFTDLDIKGMLAYHRAKGAKATIALTPVADPSAYGLIETDAGGRITRFLEKPTPDQITTNTINAGTYVLEPAVLEQIPAGTKYMFEQGVFPGLLGRGDPVYGYSSDAYWIDMGTPQKYRQLNTDLLTRHMPGVSAGASRVDPEACLNGPVLLGDGCVVARSACINGPAVVGGGCRVGEGSVISGSVLWKGVSIGSRVSIKDSILADGCRIEDGCNLDEAVLGHGATVKSGALLKPGTKVEPDAVVGEGGALTSN